MHTDCELETRTATCRAHRLPVPISARALQVQLETQQIPAGSGTTGKSNATMNDAEDAPAAAARARRVLEERQTDAARLDCHTFNDMLKEAGRSPVSTEDYREFCTWMTEWFADLAEELGPEDYAEWYENWLSSEAFRSVSLAASAVHVVGNMPAPAVLLTEPKRQPNYLLPVAQGADVHTASCSRKAPRQR